MPEPNKARQDEELESLRAIYSDDWQDIPPQKTAWGTELESGWWQVTLRSVADERVSVKLRGKMTQAYPHQVPPLSLREPEHLSALQVKKLHGLVQDKAKSLVGNEMIFELADTIVDYITNNHLPLRAPGDTGINLMEEKARREEAQRAALEAERATEQERKQKKEEETNRLLNERIQQDTIRKKETIDQAHKQEEARRRQQTVATLEEGDLISRQLDLDEPISIHGYEGKWKSWIMFGGRRETLWTTYIAEPNGDPSSSTSKGPNEVTFVKAAVPRVNVQIIDFAATYYSTQLGQKRIDAVVVEALRLREVQSDHVLKIYAVKREKSPKGWERLILVTEAVVDGGKLKSWLPKEGFGEVIAKEYIIQVLLGLRDLHQRNTSQRQIDLELALIITNSAGDKVIKLSGAGYARRIVDMHRSNNFLKGRVTTTPDDWQSPEEHESPHSYTKQRDMWHVGLLLLQLLHGPDTLQTYHNFHAFLHNSFDMSESMTDLLAGLLHTNPKKRLTTDEALARLRSDDETTRRARNISGPSLNAGLSPAIHSPADRLGTSPTHRGLVGYFPNTMNSMTRSTRYRSDFEEVEFLGKGGFGEVVKALNKLDRKFYAIKKIKLRPEDDEEKFLREIKNLSSVNHQHVVRYYGCWLEDATPREDDTTPAAAPTTLTPVPLDQEEDLFAVNFDDMSISRRDQSRSASFPRIRFANSNEDDEEDEDDEEEDYDEYERKDRRVVRNEDEDDSSDTESDSSSDTISSDSDTSTAADPSEIARGRSLGVPIAARPSTSYTTSTTDGASVQRILYIQMEFVEKQTLREYITDGLDQDEVWRLLLQILSALSHMATLGIVHRDLKPSNILLDSDHNVKIADFGLSITELSPQDLVFATGTVSNVNQVLAEIDRTSNIGTSLYIAPEVAISRSYNEKADMYSLGIIFFEMCYPFKTAMERVSILNSIRQPTIIFPTGWPVGHKPNEREIVVRLLTHDPDQRLKASDLLKSPLLPMPERRQEYWDTAIIELSNPRSAHHEALLESLFDKSTHQFGDEGRQAIEFTYDNDHDPSQSQSNPNAEDYDPQQLQVWLTVVTQRLVELFQRHGAVDCYLPLLMPETKLLNAFTELEPVRLMDKSGQLVQLPFSDLLAMARSASRNQIERIKRYHVGKIFENHPIGGQPLVSGELSFDIISPLRSAASEAELLDVVDKVISEFRGMRGSSSVEYDFHINHESVLQVILSSIPDRVDKPRRRILEEFKKLGPLGPINNNNTNQSGSGSKTRSVLGGVLGIPKLLVDDLEQCCVVDDFELVKKKLESLFSSTSSKRKLSLAFDEIQNVILLANAFGVKRRILFRPTLARKSEYFRGGFMFECVRRGKQREIVAFGGRYDYLLEHFKKPEHFKQPELYAQSRRVFGVGMTIAVDQLARIVSKYESSLSRRLMEKPNEDERSFGYWSPARCDVYVAAMPQVDLSIRLSIIGELWRAGIRADLQYDDNRSLDEITQECQDQNILYLIMPRVRDRSMKVRSILRRTDEEVARSELCTHLRIVIAEQRRIDASYATAEGSIPSAQAATMSVEPKHAEVDIKLVLPPEPISSKGTKGRPVRKHRHGTKSVYYDKATEFANSTLSKLPIIGIDLPISLISQMTLEPSWINDEDSFRSLLLRENVVSADRKYVDSVREAIKQRDREKGWLWLFSVREARGFLLQLGSK